MKNSEEQKDQHILKAKEENHKLKKFTSQISFLNEHSTSNKQQQEGDKIAQKMPQFLEMIQKIKFKFMARRLLNSTRSFMFKNILPQQLKQIDDKSYATESGKGKKRRRKKEWMLMNSSYDPRQSNNQIIKTTTSDGYDGGKVGMSIKFICRNQFLQQFLKMVDRKIQVFDPTSVEKIVWDVINVVMIFVYTIQIPLFVTFNQQREWKFHWFLIISVPFFLFIDIFLAINTGCYDKGRLIKKRINLLDINFTRQIVPDFLISMSYALFIIADYPLRGITDPGSIVIRWRDVLLLPLFWKLQEFGEIVEKLQGHSILSKKSRNIIGLIKLILTIVYIGHLLSCFWILIAELENSLGYSTWTKLKQFESASWHQMYIDSYYFSTVTMITVGYGDLIPVNEAEKTICIVIMIFSCGVFAYSMNTVGAILESFNEDQVKKNLNMSIINAYMTRKNVSKLMKNQIREYLDYYWKEESERDQEAEEKIISQLSDQLKKGLLVESKNVVLKKSAIFRNNFSDAVKELIVPLIKEYRCSPQEMICIKGDPNDCSIYFIEKGSVEVIFESSDAKSNMVKTLACISTGDSFGEGSFFTGKCRSASIRSREFTTLLILNRAEFLKILVNYPDDYEKFCTIRDSICFYDDFKQIGVSCLSCNSKMHQIANCNYLHFNANTPHLREMFSSPKKQERELYSRQRNSRSSARLNVGIVNKKALNYQEQHEDSIDYLDYGQEESENSEDNSEQKDENDEEMLDLTENNKHSIPKNQIINEEETEEDSISKREKNQRDKDDIDSPTSKGSLKYSSDKTPKASSAEGVSIFQAENASKNLLGFTEMHQQYDNSILNKGLFSMKNQNLLSRTNSLSPSSSTNQKKSKFIAYQSDSSNLGDSGEFQRQKSGTNLGKTYQKIMMVKALESGLKKKELIKRSNQKLGTISGKPLSPYTPYLQENSVSNKKSNLGFLRGANRKQSVNSDRKMTFLGKFHLGNPMNNNTVGINEIRRPSIDNRIMIGSIDYPVENNDLQLDEQYDEERTKIDKANKVEDDFDAMQNFMFYFPLNNFNYQMQLLQIPKEERRRIMIWNSYDSNSQIVIKNSSFRTKRREKKAPVLNLTVKRQPSNNSEKQPARAQDKALSIKLIDSDNMKIKKNQSQKFSDISPQKQDNIQKDGIFSMFASNGDRKLKESQTIVVPGVRPYRYSQRQSTIGSVNQNSSSNGNINNNNNQMVNNFIPIRTSSLLGGKPSAETSATITMQHNDLTEAKHVSSVNCFPMEGNNNNNNGQSENTKGNVQNLEIDKQDSQILHQSNQSNNCITFDNLIPQNSYIPEQRNQGDIRSRDVEYIFDDSLFSMNDLPVVLKDYRDQGAPVFQSDNGYNITVQDSELTQELGANKPNIENVFFQSVTSKRI